MSYLMLSRLLRSRFAVFAPLVLILIATYPSASKAQESGLTERERNKAVVTRFMQMRHKLTSKELAAEFLAESYEQVRDEFENLSYNIQGSELAKQAQPLKEAIENRQDSLYLVMGEGSSVAVRYYISGTHAGNLYGIPATDKHFEIESVAIFQLHDERITKGWFMADEVGLLLALGKPMPAREDGKYNIPPTGGELAISSDDILSFMLANPADTREYRNKLKVAARKANTPPPGIISEERKHKKAYKYPNNSGKRPYDNYTRPGYKHLVGIGMKLGDSTKGFLGGVPDRVDLMDYFMIDGDHIMIRFRVTGTNTVSLFGLPPSNKPVDGWEVAIMTFEGEHWRDAWWIGDDQSMLMQIGGPQSYWFEGVPEARK